MRHPRNGRNPAPPPRYITEKDLAFFNHHALDGGACEGASPWEVTLDKDVPGLVRYTAWRRTLPGGKTEYKSVTIAADVTPCEFMDLYLDDSFRRVWVRGRGPRALASLGRHASRTLRTRTCRAAGAWGLVCPAAQPCSLRRPPLQPP